MPNNRDWSDGVDEYDEVAESDGRGIYAVADSAESFVHSFDMDEDWFVRGFDPEGGARLLWVGIADNPVDALERFAVGEGFARYADSDMRREVAGWSWDDMGSDPAGAVAPFTNHEVYTARVADIVDARRQYPVGGGPFAAPLVRTDTFETRTGEGSTDGAV